MYKIKCANCKKNFDTYIYWGRKHCSKDCRKVFFLKRQLGIIFIDIDKKKEFLISIMGEEAEKMYNDHDLNVLYMKAEKVIREMGKISGETRNF